MRLFIFVEPRSPRKQRLFCLAIVAFAALCSALLAWMWWKRMPTTFVQFLWPLSWMMSTLNAQRQNPSF